VKINSIVVNMSKVFKIFIYSLLSLVTFTNCSTKNPGVPSERIILIGIDGMGVEGFQKAKTPNLDALASSGAISLKTRAVMPTVSGPNWSSHLLGAGPEQHGITANDWTVDNYSIEATKKDKEGFFPSIFNLIAGQIPNSKTCFYYDWDALSNFYNIEKIDKVEFSKSFEQTFEKATPWIVENDPLFSFIYIGHPDEVGHEYKWGSSQYIKAIEDVDKALGNFFAILKKENMFDDTHFIVVTDHGGVNNGHGGLSMTEVEIPWIISGPGILQDRLIEQSNDVYNTASTIAYLLELEQPYEWIGRPVLGAFVGESKFANENIHSYVPQPFGNIESGLYFKSNIASFEVSDPTCTIRFTWDGSDPIPSSMVYSKPIAMLESKVVKAAAFKDEQRSRITTINFRNIKKANIEKLAFQPDPKYIDLGSNKLSDGKIGSKNFDDGEWIGFRGTNLDAILSFGRYTDIKSVSIGFLNEENSWIFLPKEIIVLASVDGNYFLEIGRKTNEEIPKDVRNGRVELKVKIKPAKTRFLRVIAGNIGDCPSDHPGEGEPAWLFVDEIIIE